MSDKTREQRIWEIEYSCDHRPELAERIVNLEDELQQSLYAERLLSKGNLRIEQERDFWRKQAEDMYLHVTDNLLEQEWPIGDGEINPSSMVMAVEQGTSKRIEDLETENSKLRELVVDWYNVECGRNSYCTDCKRGDEQGRCTLLQRMRELGIEVHG